MALEREYLKIQRWEAWRGSKEHLARLCHAVERASVRAEPVVEKVKTSWGSSVRPLEMFTSFSAKTETETMKGDYNELIKELDHRTCLGMRINLFGSYSILPDAEISMKTTAAVELKVGSAADVGWGRLSSDELADEIRKGVPPWALVHGLVGVIAVPIITFLAVGFLFYSVLSRTTSLDLAWQVVLPLASGILAGFTVSRSQFREKLWPRFELLPSEGVDSRGDRNWRAMKSVLVSQFILAILVNIAASVF